MKQKDASKRCLLCWSHSLRESAEETKPCRNSESRPRMVMAGAVNCLQLQKQLEPVFILRKMLDFPVSWIEETLQQRTADDMDSQPETWFNVCHRCMDTSVASAWKIYQQILSLEFRMHRIKEQVKKRMKDGILKSQNKKVAWQNNDAAIETKIMAFMFPELVTKSRQAETLPTYTCSDDDFVEDIFTPADDYVQDEDGNDDAMANFPFALFKEKKRRGRPKKDEQRFKNKKIKRTFHLADSTLKRKKYTWYYCRDPQCGARYSDREGYEAHLRAHEERKQKCGDGEGGDLLEKGELDCPHCAFPARDKLELELHIENRHKKTKNNYNYRCPMCDYTVQHDFTAFKNHFDQQHPSPRNDEPHGDESKISNSSELPVVCPVCTKHCENLKSFTVHQRIQHPELVGIQVQLVKCDECGLKFSTQLKLKSHILAKHRRHARFVCDECGEGFQFMSRLEAHKITHTSKWKRDFVCHLCGLDYAHKWILEQHYRQFHNLAASGDGDPTSGTAGDVFKCKYCDLTSPFKPVIMRHLQQHKQEIGHSCEQCGKAYVSIAGLKRHLKINHPLVKEEIPCPYCHKAFVSVEYMKDHVTKFCRLKDIGNQPHVAVAMSCSSTLDPGTVKVDTLIDVTDSDSNSRDNIGRDTTSDHEKAGSCILYDNQYSHVSMNSEPKFGLNDDTQQ